MPPWGAVIGFGDFRNDQGLTQEEIELIGDWIEQDAPRGNNPNVLPPIPKFTKPPTYKTPKGSISATRDIVLDREFILDGLFPQKVGSTGDAKIVAAFPDGHTEPLLWLYQYTDRIAHPFLYRKALALPKGTTIRGVPPGAEVLLLPGKAPAAKGNWMRSLRGIAMAAVLLFVGILSAQIAPPPVTNSAGDVVWFCPMDKDIRGLAPGKCPRCGMKLTSGPPDPVEYHLSLSIAPRAPKPQERAHLVFDIHDPWKNNIVTKFTVMHEKLFHCVHCERRHGSFRSRSSGLA